MILYTYTDAITEENKKLFSRFHRFTTDCKAWFSATDIKLINKISKRAARRIIRRLEKTGELARYK